MARHFLCLFCPDIPVCPDIPGGRLKQLVEWCDRYSPLVAADGCDGIVLDITGCSHLFGGEGTLLLDIQWRFHKMGIESRGAIADTWGSAWALARYSNRSIVHGENADAALANMPVEALRLPADVVLNMRRLGLSTVALVKKIPRTSLAARFGPALLLRLDRVFGKSEEPFTPWRPPAAHRASRILAEPVSTVSAVEYVLRDLLQEICDSFEKMHLGSRHMSLACYQPDGTVNQCAVRTSKPTRSIRHLMNLFGEELPKLKSGFGFETFVLSVLDVEALDAKQLSFLQTNPVDEEQSFDALVDRFGMKFGFQEVNRIVVRESYLPEHAVELSPASVPAAVSAEWPAYRIRPVRLIDPPMRIEVSILIPGESPVQFFIGESRHRIVRSEGPERLTGEWWRDKCSHCRARDYYRIEDTQGFRFWIFRDASEHWFLHGHLA